MTLEQARAVTMLFGKYRGKTLGQICDSHPNYIRWLDTLDNLDPRLKEAVETVANEIVDEDDDV